MSRSRSDLLAAVERSPRAAAAHDRTGWVRLFTADGRIEDPVGSWPHLGRAQIGRFYDTFIGPRYDLRDVDGEWKIALLRAYWELPSMVRQFLRNSASALPAGAQLSRGLVRNQLLRGTLGFAAGFRRAGTRQKRLVGIFLNAVARGDKFAALRTLSSTATMTFGNNEAADINDLIKRLGGAGVTKPIGAGSTVVVSVTSTQGRGLMFADVARRGDEIRRVGYFSG